MSFWRAGWPGAPTSLYPAEIAGLGTLREVKTTACSRCVVPTKTAFGDQPLCLGHAVVAEALSKGYSEKDLEE